MTLDRTLTNIATLLALSTGRVILAAPAAAAAWAEVGDAQLRSDVALLANAGRLANLTMQWPMSWIGIADALSDEADHAPRPRFIQQAARRVRNRALRQTETSIDAMRVDVTADQSRNSRCRPRRSSSRRGHDRCHGSRPCNTVRLLKKSHLPEIM